MKFKYVDGNQYIEVKVSIYLNKVNLIGRLGKSPEARYFNNDKHVTTFSIAVRRKGKDQPPDWIVVEAWNKLADICDQYLTKGAMVGIEGYLKIQTWQDRQGQTRQKPVVVADNVSLLGSSK